MIIITIIVIIINHYYYYYYYYVYIYIYGDIWKIPSCVSNHGLLENPPFMDDFPSRKLAFTWDFPASHV